MFAAGVAAITAAAFLPVLRNGWVGGWDDAPFLLSNASYRGLGTAQLRWMFTTFLGDHYQPLTWLSFACDYLLWGMNPAGYHATSLVLHVATAVLFFLLARRVLATELDAACAALLFSIHPLRVEAVAWAADRRDVLAGFLCAACLLFYARAQDEPRRRARWLTAARLAYALSLLSKAVALCLPFALLAWDWHRERLRGAETRRALVEKIPFLALALIAGAGLAASMSSTTRALGEDFTAARLFQAIYGLAFYPGKTLFPFGLSAFYEIPARWDAATIAACAVLIALVAALALSLRKEAPGLLAACLFYAIMIFPMLGLATASYTLAADRYSYIACMPFAPLAAGLFGRSRARLPAAALLCALFFLTWRQCGVWRDPETLWRRAVDAAPDSSVAQLNLGGALADRARWDEATRRFQLAIAANPACASAVEELANPDYPDAELRRVLIVNPACLEASGNLVTLRAARGEDLAGAETFYRRLLELGLRRPGLETNLAKVVAARAKKR